MSKEFIFSDKEFHDTFVFLLYSIENILEMKQYDALATQELENLTYLFSRVGGKYNRILQFLDILKKICQQKGVNKELLSKILKNVDRNPSDPINMYIDEILWYLLAQK